MMNKPEDIYQQAAQVAAGEQDQINDNPAQQHADEGQQNQTQNQAQEKPEEKKEESKFASFLNQQKGEPDYSGIALNAATSARDSNPYDEHISKLEQNEDSAHKDRLTKLEKLQDEGLIDASVDIKEIAGKSSQDYAKLKESLKGSKDVNDAKIIGSTLNNLGVSVNPGLAAAYEELNVDPAYKSLSVGDKAKVLHKLSIAGGGAINSPENGKKAAQALVQDSKGDIVGEAMRLAKLNSEAGASQPGRDLMQPATAARSDFQTPEPVPNIFGTPEWDKTRASIFADTTMSDTERASALTEAQRKMLSGDQGNNLMVN